MPPACILLADETLRWRGMLALAAIKFTHNLIKFIHFQFSGFKWLPLDVFIFATRHLKCSFKLHSKFCLHLVKPHASSGPLIITTKLVYNLCWLLCWFCPTLECRSGFFGSSFSRSGSCFGCGLGSNLRLIFDFLFYLWANCRREFLFLCFFSYNRLFFILILFLELFNRSGKDLLGCLGHDRFLYYFISFGLLVILCYWANRCLFNSELKWLLVDNTNTFNWGGCRVRRSCQKSCVGGSRWGCQECCFLKFFRLQIALLQCFFYSFGIWVESSHLPSLGSLTFACYDLRLFSH